MTELAERRLVTPSGISRVVDKLVARGWVRRETDPQDRRGFRAVLTAEGVRKLREAQVTHHGVVRERYLGRLERDDVRTLAELFEKALPGIGTAAVWPPRG
jgi:DNA-binding MarR family transcriptional regulator